MRGLPRAGLVTVGCVEQSAGWANFDAVATLRTVEPAAVGSNYRIGAASACFDSIFAHPFITDTRAALAENAALRIVGHHRREVFFRVVVFLFGEALFESTPVKRHLLQLT